MGKFSKEADKFEIDLGALFNRAIRQALLAGLSTAISSTKQDSSNAAAHWTIRARGQSRTAGRAWNKLRDLRQTKDRKRTPPVGKRREGGANRAETLTLVRDRELRDVVEKFVSGRSPATVFSFFNPVDSSPEYMENMAKSELSGMTINDAGKAAVEKMRDIFAKRIESGKARKRRL